MRVHSAYSEGEELLAPSLEDASWWERRLTRNRALKVSAGALFGLAAAFALPEVAKAHCPPHELHPCFGYPLCHPTGPGCGNETAPCCTSDNCHPDCNEGWQGCHTQRVCWTTCHQGRRVKCCDCVRGSGSPCICRSAQGLC